MDTRLIFDNDEKATCNDICSLPDSVRKFLMADLHSHALSLLLSIVDCESPIEQLMGLALEKEWPWFEKKNGAECIINPQHSLEVEGKKYRIDFLVAALINGRAIEVAVECDGHDFHEKTKDQAQRDKSRDRALQRKGITTLRFTGSEIYQNPRRCAKEVMNVLESLAEKK